MLSKFLENGGSNSLVVNGSVTPKVFSAGPDAGEHWFIERAIVAIHKSGLNGLANFFGATKLQNGILWEIDFGGSTRDMLDGYPIQQTMDWLSQGFRPGAWEFSSLTNTREFWQLVFKPDSPIEIEPPTQLKVTVQDDLSGLDVFTIKVTGQVFNL